MLRYVVITGVAGLAAVAAGGAVLGLENARRAEAAVVTEPTPAAAVARTEPKPIPLAAPVQAGMIAKAKDGHYWADAQVNGSPVRFLVDTGATTVALTADDARRLGMDPTKLDYAYSVTTASGQARGAKVKLASVSVAGARIADVDAVVIDRGLDVSLLGMSYMGRLSKWEATPSALILRP